MQPTPAQLARPIRQYVRTCASADVWGSPVIARGEFVYEIAAVTGFLAGLLLHLSGGPKRARRVLKIAQPRNVHVDEGRLVVAEARYIMWGDRKFKPPPRTDIPALILLAE